MPRRRRRKGALAERIQPLQFAESPVEVMRRPTSPVFCCTNPIRANVVPIDDNFATTWISPHFGTPVVGRRCLRSSKRILTGARMFTGVRAADPSSSCSVVSTQRQRPIDHRFRPLTFLIDECVNKINNEDCDRRDNSVPTGSRSTRAPNLASNSQSAQVLHDLDTEDTVRDCIGHSAGIQMEGEVRKNQMPNELIHAILGEHEWTVSDALDNVTVVKVADAVDRISVASEKHTNHNKNQEYCSTNDNQALSQITSKQSTNCEATAGQTDCIYGQNDIDLVSSKSDNPAAFNRNVSTENVGFQSDYESFCAQAFSVATPVSSQILLDLPQVSVAHCMGRGGKQGTDVLSQCCANSTVIHEQDCDLSDCSNTDLTKTLRNEGIIAYIGKENTENVHSHMLVRNFKLFDSHVRSQSSKCRSDSGTVLVADTPVQCCGLPHRARQIAGLGSVTSIRRALAYVNVN